MMLYGHRGAKGEAPENTIAGCRYALAKGAKRLEIDVRLSADHQLVVIHDNDTERITGKRFDVAKLRAAELAALDASAVMSGWTDKTDVEVPSLDNLVKALPAIEHWQLEMKAGHHHYNNKLVEAMLTWLDTQQKSLDRFIVTCAQADMLDSIKVGRKAQPVGLIVSEASALDALANSKSYDYWVANWRMLNRQIIQRLKRKGVHLSVWTVNEADKIRELYELGVDSIISDYPSMAAPLLAQLQS